MARAELVAELQLRDEEITKLNQTIERERKAREEIEGAVRLLVEQHQYELWVAERHCLKQMFKTCRGQSSWGCLHAAGV